MIKGLWIVDYMLKRNDLCKTLGLISSFVQWAQIKK